MGFNNVFHIAGSALKAETVRLAASTSNMSNANVESDSPDTTYRAQYPVFETVRQNALRSGEHTAEAGVGVSGVYESEVEPLKRYAPNNPMADKDGFVYSPRVDYATEMTNAISAQTAYRFNLEALSTIKSLIRQTIQLGE